MNIKSKFALLTVSLGLLAGAGCSRNEIEYLASTQSDQEHTIQVDLKLEATASMPVSDEELRAGGLRFKYLDGVPFFTMKDSVSTIEAHCVFKPLKANSETELDDSRALYGTVTFKRKGKSEPQLVDGKSVAMELISEGVVTLKGNGKLGVGEQWYVMGLVGGTADTKGQKIDVQGMTIAVEDKGIFDGIDNRSTATVPFLSKWVKLGKIKEENKVASAEPVVFKFQGLMVTLDVQNDTHYKLTPTSIQIQSTELTRHVSYDLSSSNNILDTQENVKVENAVQKDESGRWYISRLRLSNLYQLDPKALATNGNYLYDKKESEKHRATIVFWSHILDNASSVKRTGFFISSINDEAKPAWDEDTTTDPSRLILKPNTESGTQFKYALTSDPNIDGIARTGVLDTNNPLSKKTYAPDIRMAPSMDLICARAIQRSLKNNLGKYVHLTIKVPERPVMPIETMAQNNMYSYRDGGNGIHFVGFPGEDTRDLQTQTANYTRGFASASETNRSYWMLPSMKQWHGLLMPGHNPYNTHNFNDQAYNFFEGETGDLGIEEIEFSDGTVGTYYAVYTRPDKGQPNDNVAYSLRFFKDVDKKIGSDQFALTRYIKNSYGGKPVLTVESVWLGPEYAKLYDGIYASTKDWLLEISKNDTDSSESLFSLFRRAFVTRHLVVQVPKSPSQYLELVNGKRFPKADYTLDMVGYFAGPSNQFNSSGSRARAIVYKQDRLFSGPSTASDLSWDFTDYYANGTADAYVRPIRRDFTQFSYKL